MFAAIRTAFKKHDNVDPLTAATSHAIQENTQASARLKEVMCKVLDGENCNCIQIKKSLQQ